MARDQLRDNITGKLKALNRLVFADAVLNILKADTGADGGDRLAAIVRVAVELKLASENVGASESDHPWLASLRRRGK
jgi:hypothetical protein